ncbi:MAG: hypothetical protein LBQ88_22570 [Treponema sp.]|jgi:hypothetical protein|nr:hypothetical protein [Treponema sp.]
MKYEFPHRLSVVAVLVFVFSVVPLNADSFWGNISWSFRGSILIMPEDNGLESDPTPVLPVFGLAAAFPLPISIPFPFTNSASLETSLDLYYNNYGYSYSLQRTIPLAIENRWTQVLGFVLGIHFLSNIPINSLLNIRVSGGFAADMRLCLIAADLNDFEMDQAAEQTEAVTNYFWGSGRWLLPVMGTGLDISLNEKFLLGLDLRVWFPLYRLWTGEEVPFIEGWRFGAGFKLTVR